MGKFVMWCLLAAFAVTVSGAGLAEASGPGKKHEEKKHEEKKKRRTITVTEVETEARLLGVGTQLTAKGHAESEEVTVTDTTAGTSTTNSCFTVGVKGLTLADDAVVTFQLNGVTIGTGTVKYGRASLRLSTKKGDTVPAVVEGDTLTVLDTDGVTEILSGAFGAAETEVETSGK